MYRAPRRREILTLTPGVPNLMARATFPHHPSGFLLPIPLPPAQSKPHFWPGLLQQSSVVPQLSLNPLTLPLLKFTSDLALPQLKNRSVVPYFPQDIPHSSGGTGVPSQFVQNFLLMFLSHLSPPYSQHSGSTDCFGCFSSLCTFQTSGPLFKPVSLTSEISPIF